jgi:hypothetical protein
MQYVYEMAKCGVARPVLNEACKPGALASCDWRSMAQHLRKQRLNGGNDRRSNVVP